MDGGDDDDLEIVGQTEPYENVIDFKSRGAWSPPPPPDLTPRDKIVERHIDHDAIEQLEWLLEQFQEGRYYGLAATVGVFDPKGNMSKYRQVISEVATSYPVAFMGAVENMKLSLSDFAVVMVEEGSTVEEDEDEEILVGD